MGRIGDITMKYFSFKKKTDLQNEHEINSKIQGFGKRNEIKCNK